MMKRNKTTGKCKWDDCKLFNICQGHIYKCPEKDKQFSIRDTRIYLKAMAVLAVILLLVLLLMPSCKSQDQDIFKQDERLKPYLQTVEKELLKRTDVDLNLTGQINLILKDFGVEKTFLLNPNDGPPWEKYAFNTIWIDETVFNTLHYDYPLSMELLMIHEVTHFLWFEHFEVIYTLEPLNKIGSDFNRDHLDEIYDKFVVDIDRKYGD